MPFNVKIRKKNPSGKPGACFGTFGPFTTQKLAKKQAQVFADDAAPGMVVTVEPVRAANPRKKVKKAKKAKARRRNSRHAAVYNLTDQPSSRVVGGALNPRRRNTGVQEITGQPGAARKAKWQARHPHDMPAILRHFVGGTKAEVKKLLGRGWQVVGRL